MSARWLFALAWSILALFPAIHAQAGNPPAAGRKEFFLKYRLSVNINEEVYSSGQDLEPQTSKPRLKEGNFSKTLKTGAADRGWNFYTGKYEDGASRDSARGTDAVGRGVAGDYS